MVSENYRISNVLWGNNLAIQNFRVVRVIKGLRVPAESLNVLSVNEDAGTFLLYRLRGRPAMCSTL